MLNCNLPRAAHAKKEGARSASGSASRCPFFFDAHHQRSGSMKLDEALYNMLGTCVLVFVSFSVHPSQKRFVTPLCIFLLLTVSYYVHKHSLVHLNPLMDVAAYAHGHMEAAMLARTLASQAVGCLIGVYFSRLVVRAS